MDIVGWRLVIVVTLGTGDEATALDPEAAVLAARTMWDEAAWVACKPCVTFTFEDGSHTTVFRRKELG